MSPKLLAAVSNPFVSASKIFMDREFVIQRSAGIHFSDTVDEPEGYSHEV